MLIKDDTVAYLGEFYQTITMLSKLLDSFAHYFFTLTTGIALGIVKDIDCYVVQSFHTRKCLLYVN